LLELRERNSKTLVVMSGRKKKRRGRILFSSRKQLQRAMMGRKRAKVSKADISDTAKVLSYNVTERGDDCECSSDTTENSTVRFLHVGA
jgi:hypothetical protein